ncbi:MAG TPA: fibronectin type III domain-containing protein [Candidatus Binatia bacterium]
MRQRPARLRPALALLFIAMVFVVAASCGKKGPPRAPELAVPQVIGDLKAEAGRTGVILTWSRPTRYVDGQRLRDLQGFVVFRKEISPSCPDCPVPFREQFTVLIDDQERLIQKPKFRTVDQTLSPGATYIYRVFSRLVDGSLSEPSNEASITWRP